MAVRQLRAPDGRRWTLKEWIQGRPLRHPTHPMFVHFPIAFYLGIIVFDVMSRITPNSALVLASSYLFIGAFLGTAAAAFTGLIDWFGMISGSSKKGLATRHMVLQLAAAAFFNVTFVLRWGDRGAAQAEITWIVLEVIGYAVLVVGQLLGGLLVYERGMRVSTGGAKE